MTLDFRKHQAALLRYEQSLKEAATAAAALSALGAPAVLAHSSEIETASSTIESSQTTLLHLAEMISSTHSALEAQAIELGARLIPTTSGGVPKRPPVEALQSILQSASVF